MFDLNWFDKEFLLIPFGSEVRIVPHRKGIIRTHYMIFGIRIFAFTKQI